MIKNLRIEEIDVLKGIGILMVLCSHFMPPVGILQYILNFDSVVFIPLFFFATGLSDSTFDKSTILRKTMKLLVPYIFFYIVLFTIGEMCRWDNNQLWGLLYSRYWIVNGDEIVILMPSPYGPLWFLTAMFSTSILICIMSPKLNKMYYGGGIWIPVLVISSFIIGKYCGNLPWSIENAPLYASYYFFAKLLKTRDTNFHPVVMLGLLLVYTILSNTVGSINWSLSLFGINYFYTYTVSLVGIVLFYSLAKKRMGVLSKALSFMGRESLAIFATHLLFSVLLKSVCDEYMESSMFYKNYHKCVHVITMGLSIILTFSLAHSINKFINKLTNSLIIALKIK